MKHFYFKLILIGASLLMWTLSMYRWQPHDALLLGSPGGLSFLLCLASLALLLPRLWGYPIAALCSFLVVKKITDDWLGWNSEMSGVVLSDGSLSYENMVERIRLVSIEHTTEAYIRESLFLGLALTLLFYSLIRLLRSMTKRRLFAL
jgi:hypothetical protein